MEGVKSEDTGRTWLTNLSKLECFLGTTGRGNVHWGQVVCGFYVHRQKLGLYPVGEW